MGVFGADPLEMLGHLSGRLLRSARLVADTGLHAFGWTEEEATLYLATNTALSEERARAEVARYVTWPGQATAYAVGEAAIRAARSSRESRANFDLRRFHVHVLSCLGPVDESFEDCIQMMEDVSKQ